MKTTLALLGLALAAATASAQTTYDLYQNGVRVGSQTITLAPPPPKLTMGVDLSKLPAHAAGYSAARVKSAGTDTSQQANPSDIGAFRDNCDFSHMNTDDPIVFPGQPGAAHLHTYFGNTGASAGTTTTNVATTGNSTCGGGTLNRSAYWVPSMIDTKDGTPLAPTSNNVYYKDSYDFDIHALVKAVPTGLRFIAGNARNTDPAKVGARYICLGPKGENPGWKNTITDAFKDGTCLPGGDFVMNVNFPQCWDGVNLDSTSHQSHVVGVVQDQAPPWAKHCPADHPVVLPSIAYNVHYSIQDATAVSRWRLSSDLMLDPQMALPAGTTGHGDYMMGWDTATMATFVANCLGRNLDCHDYLLGDGRTLY